MSCLSIWLVIYRNYCPRTKEVSRLRFYLLKYAGTWSIRLLLAWKLFIQEWYSTEISSLLIFWLTRKGYLKLLMLDLAGSSTFKHRRNHLVSSLLVTGHLNSGFKLMTTYGKQTRGRLQWLQQRSSLGNTHSEKTLKMDTWCQSLKILDKPLLYFPKSCCVRMQDCVLTPRIAKEKTSTWFSKD